MVFQADAKCNRSPCTIRLVIQQEHKESKASVICLHHGRTGKGRTPPRLSKELSKPTYAQPPDSMVTLQTRAGSGGLFGCGREGPGFQTRTSVHGDTSLFKPLPVTMGSEVYKAKRRGLSLAQVFRLEKLAGSALRACGQT